MPVSVDNLDSNSLREEIQIEIKSLLYSSKDGLTDNELKNEYRNIFGKEVQYSMFGYRNLYEFMRDMGDGVDIKRHKDGVIWVYYAKYDEVTKDLGKLVSTQLDKNKKARENYRSYDILQRSRRFKQNGNGRSFFDNFSTNNYRAKSVNSLEARPFEEFFVENSENSSNKPSKTEFHKCVPLLLKKQIESILTGKENKISLSEFEKEYESKNGYLFNPRPLGFDSLVDLFKFLQDLVACEPNEDATDYYISLVSKLPSKKEGIEVIDIEKQSEYTMYHELTDESKIRTKLSRVNDDESACQYMFNLISIDDYILVHWTQVAAIFGMNSSLFKHILNKERKDPRMDFIRSYKLNENNSILFDLVENKLNLKLKDLDEEDEILFICYDKLFKCCDFIFNKESLISNKIKSIIKKFWLS